MERGRLYLSIPGIRLISILYFFKILINYKNDNKIMIMKILNPTNERHKWVNDFHSRSEGGFPFTFLYFFKSEICLISVLNINKPQKRILMIMIMKILNPTNDIE